MFSIEITTPPSDIDDLGHVSNVAFVRWIQEVAVAHSAASGWTFAEYQRIGAIFVVRKHEVEYLAPAFAGDRITLSTWVEAWTAATADRRTRIVRDGVELVRATTLWVLVSTEGGRPRRIPPEMRGAFE